MTHDEYLSRVETWTDEDAPAVLAHAESCSACRRDLKAVERSLARLDGRPRTRFHSNLEEAASVAAVAAILAIAIGGLSLSSPSGRSATPATPVARYRIVGGPAGVVAYTPTETIVASGGGARTSNDEKETHR